MENMVVPATFDEDAAGSESLDSAKTSTGIVLVQENASEIQTKVDEKLQYGRHYVVLLPMRESGYDSPN